MSEVAELGLYSIVYILTRVGVNTFTWKSKSKKHKSQNLQIAHIYEK